MGRVPYPAVWISFVVVLGLMLTWMFAVGSGPGSAELRRFTADAATDRWLGIVTTITTSLLLTGAAFHAAGAVCGPRSDRAIRRFHLGQAVVVGWLGLDDRLLIHEAVGNWISMSDSVVLGVYGCIAIVLFAIAPVRTRRGLPGQFLLATALAFGVMLFVDGIIDQLRFGQLPVGESFKVTGVAIVALYCAAVTVYTLRESGVGGRGSGVGGRGSRLLPPAEYPMTQRSIFLGPDRPHPQLHSEALVERVS